MNNDPLNPLTASVWCSTRLTIRHLHRTCPGIIVKHEIVCLYWPLLPVPPI